MWRVGVLTVVVASFALTARAAPEDAFLDSLAREFAVDGMIVPPASLARPYADACAQGVAMACAPDRWRVDGRPDREAAGALFQPACAAGDDAACVVMGWLDSQVRPGSMSNFARDPASAARAFEGACERGHPRACSDLAWMLAKGVGADEDPGRATELSRQACDAGVGNACLGLASLLNEAKDAEGARRAWERGCELGDGDSCGALAEKIEDQDTSPTRACRLVFPALVSFRGSPSGGDVGSCRSWVVNPRGLSPRIASRSAGFFKPPERIGSRAAELRRQACSLGVLDQCLYLVPRSSSEILGPLMEQIFTLVQARGPAKAGTASGATVALATEAALADCARGVEDACRQMLNRIDDDDGSRLDRSAALATLKQGCDASAPSCRYLGLYYLSAHEGTRDPLQGMDALKRACDAQEQGACVTLGWYKVNGRGLGFKPGEARVLWEQACEAGNADGCNAVSQGWQGRFWGKKGKPQVIFDHARRACLLSLSRCTPLGRLYQRGVGTTPDPQRATALYLVACESGSASGCVSLGWNMQAGYGIERDELGADALFQRACGDGLASGCAQVAISAIEQGGTMPDGGSPVDALREGCNEGSVSACAGRGWTYLRGVGLTPDLVYGTALLEGACSETTSLDCGWGGCELESAQACRWLSEAYTEGLGVPKDLEKAGLLLDQACDRGDVVACDRQGASAEQR